MAFAFNHSVVTKKIIDLLVGFLRTNARRSRLYTMTQISDRFDYEQTRVPAVIVKSVTNTQRRTHYDDFIVDEWGHTQLIPISGDSNLVGNNLQRNNLPDTLDYDPRYAFDPSIGYPSGVDITEGIYTGITGSSLTGTSFNSGVTTGIVINIPPATTYDPESIVYALDCPRLDGTPSPINPPGGTGLHTIAVALSDDQEQFYLVYSGTSLTGTVIQPVEPDQIIVNASGLVPGLTGTTILLNDVLWAGDQYQIQTYNTDQFVYGVYGGVYDISIAFDCYAGSTIEAQELGDLIEGFLVYLKRDVKDLGGFNLTGWSQPGQAEADYINGHIFSCGVACEGFVWWQEYRSVDLITSASGTAIPVKSINVSGIATGFTTTGGSGRTVNGTGLISSNASGIHYISTVESGLFAAEPLTDASILAVNAIYSGNNTSTDLYAPSFDSTGTGWSASGTTIFWSNGENADFGTAVGLGLIPSSGQTYYVDYTYRSSYAPPGIETTTQVEGPAMLKGGFQNYINSHPIG